MSFKKFLPLFIGLSGIIITLIVCFKLVHTEREHIKSQIQNQAKSASLSIQGEILSQIHALKRMAKRWEVSGKPPKFQWESDAANYVKHSHFYQAIEWVDPALVVQWIVPSKGNQQAMGFDNSIEEKRRNTLEKSRDLRKTIATPTLDLVQGGKGILIFVPIFHKDQFEGFICGVFNIAKLLNLILTDDRAVEGYSLSLLEGKQEIFNRSKSAIYESDGWIARQPIRFFNVNWTLQVRPNENLLDEMESPWPQIMLGVGILMAVLLGITFHLALRARDHSHAVEAANLRLEKARDELEQKVELRTRELQRSNKDLEDFASIASHDLQEPLRKIVSFGDRLRSMVPNLDDQNKNYLERMQSAAERMQQLIADLLHYSKMTSGKKSFRKLNLKDVIERVMDDLEIQIANTGGTVRVNDMPTLEVDPIQIHQLFQNLVSNALKYHRKGVHPEVRVESSRGENGFWTITIEDNGIGIEEKHRERIFDPFERLHGRNSYEGTGMGLAICKKIVSSHGGSIFVQHPAGQGTIFVINLPEFQSRN